MSGLRPTLCLLAMLLPATAGAQQIESASWRLVAAYDGAAAARQVGPPDVSFTWEADPALEAACGRPKGPIGFGGAMDAELIAQARAPYLVLLLAGAPGRPLTTSDLVVFVGDPDDPIPLAPAVVPRRVRLTVEADDSAAGSEAINMRQQLRSQLTVQLCLEHQTGRAWQGLGRVKGERGNELQNAFMLNKVEAEDRRLFVGQGTAAAPLLGPPRWAPRWSEQASRPPEPTASDLNAGDLFGFRPPGWSELAAADSPSRVPLTVGGVPCPGCRWRRVPEPGIVELALHVGAIGTGLGLSASFQVGDRKPVPWRGGASVSIPEEVVIQGVPTDTLHDVLSEVPYDYPRFEAAALAGEEDDRPKGALAALIVPAWQLVNAMRLLEEVEVEPLSPLSSEPADGVGWILQNLDLLHLQDANDPSDPRVDLVATAYRPGPLGAWGSTPDRRAVAAPIVLPGSEPASAGQQAAAVRRGVGNLSILAAIFILIFLVPGLSRVSELWSARPRERAWGWPKRKQATLTETAKGLAEKGGKP